MADIDVERKSGASWIWWILGLILLALLIWAIAEMLDDDAEVVDPVATEVVEPAPVMTPAPVAGATGATGAPTIAEVMANPASYYGQPLTLESARVAEVVSDRGFWLEGEGGQRLFVVKNESPQAGTADVQGQADVRPARNVNANETLRINGTLHDASNLDALQPPLDNQTRQALQGQQIFLQANVADIQHL